MKVKAERRRNSRHQHYSDYIIQVLINTVEYAHCTVLRISISYTYNFDLGAAFADEFLRCIHNLFKQHHNSS